VYDTNQSTGFVQTGSAFVGSQVFVSALRR
jgi:hypothetical protein